MSLAGLDALSPRQREWLDAMMGRSMHVGNDTSYNAGDGQYGTVVDFKLDTAGVGVFFVLDRGKHRSESRRYVERYRKLPHP